MLEGPEAQVKTVTVLIDVTQKQAKAYRGGYKDKRSGTLYHHADCQTDRQVCTHGKLCAQRDLNTVVWSQPCCVCVQASRWQTALHVGLSALNIAFEVVASVCT